MKTMASKYPGTCGKCGESFGRGAIINWHGRGRVEHQTCPRDAISAQRAPCWICKSPDGQFRNLGAATPVWCDTCFAKEQAKTQTVGRVRFTRFSSGAEVYQNARGRCEDAPCCGCCS